jgi:hypothetical protein
MTVGCSERHSGMVPEARTERRIQFKARDQNQVALADGRLFQQYP